MTDIPEDMMKAVLAAMEKAATGSAPTFQLLIPHLIARAIMVERERCATVMDGLAKEYRGHTEEQWAFEHAAEVLRGTAE